MTGLLVKFGLVMLVVMSGFAISFYTLFKDRQSYGEVRSGLSSNYRWLYHTTKGGSGDTYPVMERGRGGGERGSS